MNPLHPHIVIIWRVIGLSLAAGLAAAVALLEAFVLAPADLVLLMPGGITGLVAALVVTLALWWPALRYRAWRWEVEPNRVFIRKGVLWRSYSLVPRVRIQHVDTRNSPLQRWLGLSTLVIYTAGTRGADAAIPGLEAQQAEALREELAQLEELAENA